MKDIIVENNCKEELKKIIANKSLKMQGTLFKTKNKTYFYDTGTGKVVELDNSSINILSKLYDENYNFDNFIKNIDEDDLIKFITNVKELNLFKASKPDKLYTLNHYENLEKRVNENMEQIILELTGKCNLRCKYCIYNDDFAYNRSFNSDDMTVEIAKKALDYFKEHSGESVAVTFYGGEPLIKFDLLKWAIEYSQELFKDKKLSFSLTTNLTLVTDEIAKYLSSIPNLHIVCSIDGPLEEHDRYRKKADGTGSFNDAYRGLKLLSKYFKNKDKNLLSINGVLGPPFYYEKIEKVNAFFAGLDFLPDDCSIQVSYPSDGSLDGVYSHIEELRKDPEYVDATTNSINPLWDWGINKLMDSKSIIGDINKISAGNQQSSLLRIHHRLITDDMHDTYPFNGCCVPGARRLYITTSGELDLCERIGSSPSIGDIDNGIDIDKIKKYYIKDYSDKSIEHCSDCWAIKLCSVCYADRYSENGFDRGNHKIDCVYHREGIKRELEMYHSILEEKPEMLDVLNNIKIY